MLGRKRRRPCCGFQWNDDRRERLREEGRERGDSQDEQTTGEIPPTHRREGSRDHSSSVVSSLLHGDVAKRVVKGREIEQHGIKDEYQFADVRETSEERWRWRR
jgi:hypothetical protein